MEAVGSRIFRAGSSRKKYDLVDGIVGMRLIGKGSHIRFEGAIPVTKGKSNVCFQVPVEALVALFDGTQTPPLLPE